MLTGIRASSGVAIGKALVYKGEALNIEKKEIDNVEIEIDNLQNSVALTKSQLEGVRAEAKKKMGLDKAAIFDAHIMILEDPEFIEGIKAKILEEKVSAPFAANEVIEGFISIFAGMDDEYLKERVADIRDVGGRLLNNLLGRERVDLSKLHEDVILIANDLTPSDTATMDMERVLGFITEIGGTTSHTAIMARTLEVPAIVGINNVTQIVSNGDLIVFDGNEGIVHVNPTKEILEVYQQRMRAFKLNKMELIKLKDKATITVDQRQVELACNIGTHKDIKGVLENGGEAIGLFRTEFLYMNRITMPTEEEQFKAYKEVLERMKGKPVIIRTLDIGGDKELPYLNLPKEANPFLGYRAIRICLAEPEIFRVQLRALLRASVYGNLKIMYPMISSVEEVRAANGILEEVKRELEEASIEYRKDFEVGIMIEIPSAAVIGDLLIKEVDFFSIGTNDLIQYTTAVDRLNEKISYLYEPFHPAILRLIKMVIDYAHRDGKWVGMCGEMAGDPRLIPILLGLGLDEFSMGAASILTARKIISQLSYTEMKEVAEKILLLSTADDIKDFITEKI